MSGQQDSPIMCKNRFVGPFCSLPNEFVPYVKYVGMYVRMFVHVNKHTTRHCHTYMLIAALRLITMFNRAKINYSIVDSIPS